MHYLIVADNRGEMVLCTGTAEELHALAARFSQGNFFQYVLVKRAGHHPPPPKPLPNTAESWLPLPEESNAPKVEPNANHDRG